MGHDHKVRLSLPLPWSTANVQHKSPQLPKLTKKEKKEQKRKAAAANDPGKQAGKGKKKNTPPTDVRQTTAEPEE